MASQTAARSIITLLVAAAALVFCALLYGVYQQESFTRQQGTPADWILESGLVVPEESGFYPSETRSGSALVVNGADVISTQTVHLCDQAARPNSRRSGMKALYAGLNWSQLQQLMAQNEAKGLKPYSGITNPLLDGAPDAGPDIPEVKIGTWPRNSFLPAAGKPDSAMALYPMEQQQSMLWLSDNQPFSKRISPQGLPFQKQGWLLWAPTDNDRRWHYALKVERTTASNKGRCALNYGTLKLTLLEAPDGEQNSVATVWHLPAPDNRDDQQLQIQRQRLAAGVYEPHSDYYQMEDHQLFTQAVAAGLIHAGPDGQISLQPRDAAVAAALSGESWPRQKRALLSALYYSAPGRYLRQQVQNWNRESRPAGLRFKPLDSGASGLLASTDAIPWQAVQSEKVILFGGRAPLRSGGLFRTLPQQWSDWMMLKGDGIDTTSKTPIKLKLSFSKPATGREQFRLLVIGRDVKLSSGTLHASARRCITHTCDSRRQVARAMRVSPKAGSTELGLTLQPLTADQARQLYQSDHQPVQVDRGKPVWNPPRGSQTDERYARVPVTLRDRHGTLVWQDNQTLTPLLNGYRDPLYGVSSGHQRSLAGMLSRLGRHGYPQVNAELTLDQPLQQSVREKLQQQVRKNSHPDRLGSVLMMDADSGEILATASFPEVPANVAWPDLHALDSSDFRRSPLRPRTFQHDGYSYNAPGSVFKLVVALTLERAAANNPAQLAVLEGLPMTALDRAGKEGGYRFSSRADCYPAQKGCLSRQQRWPASALKDHAIINYRKNWTFESPRSMLQKGEKTYGLTQAIRDSLNTWFVWQADKTDQTLLSAEDRYGMAHARALTPDALKTERPVQAMMRELGFLDPTRLDGGLLPETFNWRSGDLLMATPSRYDPFESRLSVRQAAIGLRMQVTPLHIAQLSASLASGQQRRGYLLKSLNGTEAKPSTLAPLEIELSRIRAGMKAVPETGTAKTAFRDKRYKSLRERIYLKTGTAPIRSNRKAKQTSVNSAWLTGWLEPQQTGGKRIAFACMLAFTPLTGGKDCAPLMANILHKMEQAEAEKKTLPTPDEVMQEQLSRHP